MITASFIYVGYDFTKEYKLLDMKFQKSWGGLSALCYSGILPGGIPDPKTIGTIGISGNMDRICIMGFAPEDVGVDGRSGGVIISAPAETIQEAVQIGDQWGGNYYNFD